VRARPRFALIRRASCTSSSSVRTAGVLWPGAARSRLGGYPSGRGRNRDGAGRLRRLAARSLAGAMSTPEETVKAALEAGRASASCRSRARSTGAGLGDGHTAAVKWVASATSSREEPKFPLPVRARRRPCSTRTAGQAARLPQILGTVGLELRHCYPEGKWSSEMLNGVKFVPDDGRPDRLQVEQTTRRYGCARAREGNPAVGSAELLVWGKIETACLSNWSA